MKRLIIPAILTDSVLDLQEKVRLANTFCTRIGVDIIDGEYADNITVLPEDLQKIEWGALSREAQLMVVEPIDYLGFLHTAGFDRVYGQVERMGNIEDFVSACTYLKMEPGLGLGLHTPVEAIPSHLWHTLPGILLLSIESGFSGQKYIDISEKIKEIRALGYEGDIQVDGGMNVHTVPPLLAIGVNQFSVTSAIWSSADPALSYHALTDLL